MRSTLIAIGNARGVRIPKAFLKQAGLRDEVEIDVRGSQIVIRATKLPRAGWSEAFERLTATPDEAVLDAPTPTVWDETEWEW